jgi:outer membrane protein assembly factor BamB
VTLVEVSLARYRADWPAASPALTHDGTLVVGFPGGLAALGVDGEVKWRHETMRGYAVFPFVAGDGTLCGLTAFGSLVLLDPQGRELAGIGGMAGGKDVVGNPALGHDGRLYVPGASALWAFGPPPRAKSAWVCRLDSKRRWHGVAVGADETVYAATDDRVLRAVRPEGTVRWSVAVGGRAAPAIAGDGTLYVGDASGQLQAVSAEGQLLWSYAAGAAVAAPPVIGADGTVYVGSDDRKLHAVTAIGTRRWAFETEGPVRSAAAVGRDGTVYVGSNDGRLYALRPDGSEKWSLATGGAVHSPTLLLDGTVVVTSGDGVVRAVRDPGSGGLADAPWPKWARDLENTARAPRPRAGVP